MKKWFIGKCAALLVVVFLLTAFPVSAEQPTDTTLLSGADTGISYRVESVGDYPNWSGVSNAAQFMDAEGNFCFALDGEAELTIVQTKHGAVTKQYKITKEYPLFGTIVCDTDGYLYIFWGRSNKTADTSVHTVFLSKYAPSGELLTTVGGNGGEGLPNFYDTSSHTKYPFEYGNCDAAISGDILLVNYARQMYNGHQSNGIFAVNRKTMQKLNNYKFYESHSFNQRVTPYSKTGGFLIASHGDAYGRAFTVAVTDTTAVHNKFESFHFWVQEGAFSRFDMYELNTTYAYLGNIVETAKGAALIATSAKSLSEEAIIEPQNVFVQVYNPLTVSASPAGYVTVGERSGIGGIDGDEPVTDYGVHWLTDYAAPYSVIFSQAVAVSANAVVVLYELHDGYDYNSTWYMVLNASGQVVVPATSIGKVRLNKDEDPIYADGTVQWVAVDSMHEKTLHIFSLNPIGMECDWLNENSTIHHFSATVIAPTCEEQGYTLHTCTCGESSKDTYVPALGHSLVTDPAIPATCTESGLSRGKHCSRCDYQIAPTVVRPLGHNPARHAAKAATCTEIGWDAYTTCLRCGDTTYQEIAALGHDIVTDAAVAATCTQTGFTEGSHCKRCDYKVAQAVTDALGHQAATDAAVAPTCTATGLTEGKHCAVCNEILVAQNVVEKLPHTDAIDAAVAPTCTATGLTEGKHCAVCKEILLAQTVVEKLPHTDAIDAAVAPTCTATGLTEGKHCAVCNEILLAPMVVEKLPHTEVLDTAVAPTCTENGLTEGKHCSVCGEVLIAQELLAAHHTEVIDAAVAPTCTENGLTEGKHCFVCNEILVAQAEIPALGHAWDNGIVTIAPTVLEKGEMTYTCTTCAAAKTEEIPESKLPFTDVPDGKWFTDAVKFVYAKNLFGGISETAFAPDAVMTRGMLVTVLWRLDGKPMPKGSNRFSDVEAGKYYAAAVAWASENEIVNGVENGKFNPDDNVTREQIAAILFRYARFKENDTAITTDLTAFPDNDRVSDWAKEALTWANAEGLIGGIPQDGITALDPQGNASRVQVATILMRYVNDTAN